MDHTQHVIAVAHILHNHPEGKEVEDLIQGFVLVEHLAVNGIGVLHTAVDDVLDAQFVEAVVNLDLGAVHEVLVLLVLGLQLGDDLLISHGIQVFQGQILQLPLDALHAQTVGDGGIDLHGLQGLLLLLHGSLVLHGAHVVEPVCNFDEDDPDVLGHGDEHFAQVLHLLIFLGGVLDPGQFADAFHQVGNGGRENAGHILMGGAGILDDVVEQGGHNGLRVQTQFLRHDLSHRQRMDDIGLSAFALLIFMGLLGKFKGGPDLGKVRRRVVAADGLFQIVVLFQNGHGVSPRFRLAAPGSRDK